VSVSGDYERFVTVDGQKYHHIIDPRTAYPGDSGVRAVTVICDNGAVADALSTAFFLMGYDAAMAVYRAGERDFEAVFFMSDGRTLTTPGADYVK
jgi:thiamine biosynthesis lipoprotein